MRDVEILSEIIAESQWQLSTMIGEFWARADPGLGFFGTLNCLNDVLAQDWMN